MIVRLSRNNPQQDTMVRAIVRGRGTYAHRYRVTNHSTVHGCFVGGLTHVSHELVRVDVLQIAQEGEEEERQEEHGAEARPQ